MKDFDLLIHRWCQNRFGRRRKGRRKKRLKKWKEARGLRHKFGISFSPENKI